MATYRNWTGRDHKRKERKNLFWSFFFLRRRAKALYLVLFTEFCFWKKKIEKKATRNGREMIMKPFPIGWPSFHPHQFAEWKISEIMELPPLHHHQHRTVGSMGKLNSMEMDSHRRATAAAAAAAAEQGRWRRRRKRRKKRGRKASKNVCIYIFFFLSRKLKVKSNERTTMAPAPISSSTVRLSLSLSLSPLQAGRPLLSSISPIFFSFHEKKSFILASTKKKKKRFALCEPELAPPQMSRAVVRRGERAFCRTNKQRSTKMESPYMKWIEIYDTIVSYWFIWNYLAPFKFSYKFQ